MKKLAILTDSTCDLTNEIIEQNDIHLLPLYVTFGDKTYLDRVEINTTELYKTVVETHTLPKTSAASPADFIKVFENLFEEYEEILYMGISGSMSSTLNNANQARMILDAEDKVFILDSKNLSTGIALSLLKACKYRDQGLSGSEVVERVSKIVPQVRSQFAIEKMDYLHKGGRCSGVAAIFGRILKIKPIIVVREGKMTVGKKPRGKMKVALEGLLDYVREDINVIDKDAIFITHTEALSACEYLKEKLTELVPDAKIYITEAGCVISSHCGPGTIGILYIKNEE